MRTRHIPRQQHIEVIQARLAQSFVKIENLIRRCLGAFDLLVRGMVAYASRQVRILVCGTKLPREGVLTIMYGVDGGDVAA